MANIPNPVPTTYTLGNCSGYTAVSEIFTFNVENICNRSGNPQLQLMWQNRYGHFDYYTFTASKIEGLDISRQTYESYDVDWGAQAPAKEQWTYGLGDFEVDMSEVHIINSGFLNQPDFMYLQELYTSNQVYEITPDGGVRPIVVLDTEFSIKNKGNREITNIQLTYVYSNNITLIGF
jgi:hypothetical protein